MCLSLPCAQWQLLDYHQWEVGLISCDPRTPHGGAWGAERLTYIFSLYDLDGDGAISGEEFVVMMRHILRAKSGRASAGQDADGAGEWEDEPVVRREAEHVWAELGFDSLASGSLAFRSFHTAVGVGKLRGTSKLFRLKVSAIHNAGALAVPTPHVDVATPVRRAGSSPGTPGSAGATPSRVTLYWKHVVARDVEAVEARRREHARFFSREHGTHSRKKVNFIDPDLMCETRSPTKKQDGITGHVIDTLLLGNYVERPAAGGDAAGPFRLLSPDAIVRLTQRVIAVLAGESTCVAIPAPCKVFGDIHGQLADLLQFFATYGSPNHYTGDIELASYVFLGDLVDRGPNSLEVAVLLLSLKVRYPEQVFIIRGNHESAEVNANYGFQAECLARLGADAGMRVWNAINEAFSWLPIAGVIADEIFCCHGGLGSHVTSVAEIREIRRPLVESQLTGRTALVVRDLLWSDPTTSDAVLGVHANVRGPDVTAFGPDRVATFCSENALSLIVRAHECVQDGFELFCSGRLVTVFSARNYTGSYDNDGAFLEVTSKLKITPKVLKGTNDQHGAAEAAAEAGSAPEDEPLASGEASEAPSDPMNATLVRGGGGSSGASNGTGLYIPLMAHELGARPAAPAGTAVQSRTTALRASDGRTASGAKPPARKSITMEGKENATDATVIKQTTGATAATRASSATAGAGLRTRRAASATGRSGRDL